MSYLYMYGKIRLALNMQEKGQIRNTTGINRHTLKFFALLVYQFSDSSCTKAIPAYHFNKLILYPTLQRKNLPTSSKPQPLQAQTI